MTEVVSIKFKNRGKTYYFDPNGLTIAVGDEVVVDTANGLEMATCTRENHMVEDTAVVLPLRPVVRAATTIDRRTEDLNRQKEKEALQICEEKIREHGLEMKLVDVEINFEGTRTTFFFTADGRVDFRELVKDLASILHNRIELRQIGVRDEAKMIGGIGICGRPFCCSEFLDGFHPVSTKMAKIQSLSLNPTKISGSCGRLMCCLRYEEEAYEDLIKKVPKQGAFVETIDGYGTAAQVNLLRQTVKVKLDSDSDDSLHLYKAAEVAAVPGGRPKDGETPPHVLQYVEPEKTEEEAPESEWEIPSMIVTPVPEERGTEDRPTDGKSHRRRHGKGKGEKKETETTAAPAADTGTEKAEKQDGGSSAKKRSRHRKKSGAGKPQNAESGNKTQPAEGKSVQVVRKTEPTVPNKENIGEKKGNGGQKKARPHRRRYPRKKPGSGPNDKQ